MNEKNMDTYTVKKLRMPVSISIIDENNKKNSQSIDPDALFTITLQPGMEIRNGIGQNLKKYNIFDYSCLHKEPLKSAFEQMFALTLLYKSELGDLEEVGADNTTVSFVCERGSEEFFHALGREGYHIMECSNGIYHMSGYMLIDVYVIAMAELKELECGWMESIIRQADDRKCPKLCINGLGCRFRVVEL